MLIPLILAPVAGLVAYSWGAHLLTLGCAWRGPRADRRVALTFDDGPDPAYTPRVLELLGREGLLGTFFLVGERATRAVDVVRAMAAGGHEVGNHTWSHTNLWKCGPRRTEAEIRRSHDLLAELAGRPPRHFRPPWGAVNMAMFGTLRRVGEHCVFWSIQPEGLRPAAAARQAAYVVRRASPGAIVDLHDAEGTRGAPARLLEALPPMIEGLRSRGFTFVTVGDLLAGTAPVGAAARPVPEERG
jgi:peptidoglycan/xylan/chitin deacetylase (PgdA/CDA1 family)